MDPTNSPIPEQSNIAVNSKPTVLHAILFITVLILASATVFLALQNISLKKQIAEITSVQPTAQAPSPTDIPERIVEWNSFSNPIYKYSFKCPTTTTHSIELQNGNGTDMPLYQEICYEGQNLVRFYVYPKSHTNPENEGASVSVLMIPGTDQKLIVRGFDKQYFNNIVTSISFAQNLNDQPNISTPKEESKISSPVTISGKIPRNWTFEANFMIEIQDEKGEVFTSTPVGAIFANETDEMGTFNTTISFTPKNASGFVVIKADNPSGLPKNEKRYTVPVNF